MKKVLVLLLLAAIVAPAFADDALVLPKGVLRTTLAPYYAFANQSFDKDGEKVDIGGGAVDSVNVWGLGAAFEYGLTDAVNIAIQWFPGWNFAGSYTAGDGLPPASATFIENQKPTGLDDFFIGSKVQILGPNGFVPNDMHRFAAAAGFQVPLSVYDAEEVFDNQVAGDEFQADRVGNDTVALGFRLYYDYVISENFFWNLYSEFQYNFPRDLEFPNDPAGAPPKTIEGEVAPGYELTFETEPDYATMIGDGLELGGSLPITYKLTGESEIAGAGQDDDTTLLTVRPTVSLFMQSLPVPTELSFGYRIPLYGTKTAAQNLLVLQIKNFLRF